MKFTFILSASTTFLLAAAATDEPSFAEAFKVLKSSDGVTHLGEDGVLRSLNAARDTVIDYVQLSEHQIAEFLAKYDKKRAFVPGIDGRAVTSDAQLWAVPDAIVAHTPNAKTSKNIRVPRALIEGRADCVEGTICNESSDCHQVTYSATIDNLNNDCTTGTDWVTNIYSSNIAVSSKYPSEARRYMSSVVNNQVWVKHLLELD